MKCPGCGNKSMIRVAKASNVDLYSCIMEECVEHAELFVMVEGSLIRYDTLLKGLMEITKK
jgi:hypothetical protein